MKTVRTRVKSAFNKRNTTLKPLEEGQPSQQLSSSLTASPSTLRSPEPTQEPFTEKTTPTTKTTFNQNLPEFSLDSDPFADLSSPNQFGDSKSRDTPQNNNIALLPEIPGEEGSTRHRQEEQEEGDYMLTSAAQAIIITDDSRRSTPKKRKKSVPRASSASYFPSPSITSRILTVIPESVNVNVEPALTNADEPKIESPVNLNYFPNESEKQPSLLEQPQPTEAAFTETTPPHESQPIPSLHELLTEQYQRRTESPVQSDHLAPYNTNEEAKPLLESSLLTGEIDHILESSTVWPLPPQTFPTLGWTEHVLPSSAYYYSHAATRTVTDLDLRDNKKLDALTQYISSKRSPKSSPVEITEKGGGTPHGAHDTLTIRTLRTEPEFLAEEGIDIWIRDANAGMSNGSSNADWVFMPLTNWVMHASRAVTYDPPSDKDPAPEDLSDAERLSLEYKYWQYMCTHPAHVSIPQSAYDEALEVLTWCYTDSVLHGSSPSPSLPCPPPFNMKECTALLELIRNISNSGSTSASQTIRTRLIAQILLRYTEWRQRYITKSLPTILNNNTVAEANQNETVEHAVPFKSTFQAIIKSVVCLGIPYLFERNGSSSGRAANGDAEEQGSETGITSKVNVGVDASQPIMAALLLSASATMLTFPNLNQITRVSAMISALFAVTSMASYGISLYSRSQTKSPKRDTQSSTLGDAHLKNSNNSIVLSIPLVLLTYSLCSFVAGVLSYAIRGASDSSSAGFGRVTGWVVLAVWVALVGVLAAFAAYLRRES